MSNTNPKRFTAEDIFHAVIGLILFAGVIVAGVAVIVWFFGALTKGDPEMERAAHEFSRLTPAERDAVCHQWYLTGDNPLYYGAWCD